MDMEDLFKIVLEILGAGLIVMVGYAFGVSFGCKCLIATSVKIPQVYLKPIIIP